MNRPTLEYLSNDDPEGALLGILQLWPDTIHQMHEINSDDFTERRNKVLWEEIMVMFSSGLDISDRVLILDQLRMHGKLETIGGAIRLSDLCSIPANSSNVSNYVSAIKIKSAELKAVVACERFKSDLGTCDTLELIERLKSDLNSSSTLSKKLQGKTLKQIGKEALDETTREKAETWQTNYFELDSALGGQIGQTSFTVIAAGPSFGKTALALNLMQNATSSGKPIKCLYVGMEMSEPEIFDRFVAADGKIPGQIVSRLRMNLATTEDRAKYMATYKNSCVNVSKAGHIIKSDGLVSISEFRALVAMYAKDVDCAILDYLQQLRPTNTKHNEMEKINEASWSCKDLALTYKIPIIALSQLNRDGYKDGCKPGLANLRASGQIEADANNVWMLWREKSEISTHEKMEIFLAKNRSGPVCRIPLDFDLKHGRIENTKPTACWAK